MEDELKNNWKKVGKDFVELGADLGKTIIKTVKSHSETHAQAILQRKKNQPFHRSSEIKNRVRICSWWSWS